LTPILAPGQIPAAVTNVKLDDKMVEAAVKLSNFKTKQEALNVALAEFVARRNRRRILELGGKIEFRPDWDYRKMRGKR
jgi:hypothetical protein